MTEQNEKLKGVFIGWSGSRSEDVAQALKHWLQCLSLDVEPWVSSLDLKPGERWWEELETQLHSCCAGILCVSPENVRSPWLHFEAGALARSVSRKRIIPYAIDMNASDIPHPIGFFQGASANREGTLKMISGLFSSIPVEYDADSNIFDVFWPFLQPVLELRESTPEDVQSAIANIQRIAVLRRRTELKEIVFPSRVKQGQKFRIEYLVKTNAHDVPVWLGASIGIAKGAWFFRADQDEVVNLHRGERRFRRYLTIPETFLPGEYDLNAELWLGPKSEEHQSYPIQRKWPVGKIQVE